MKIQCNVCEAAEAAVLCCADEAALCWGCDRKVHAANKLAGKHQRVPLSTSSSQMPMCDICQETAGYFFCLEDRALLCRKCDVAIHKANPLVSAHKRFLLTGIRVGLEAAEAHPSSSLVKTQTTEKISKPESRSLPNGTNPVSSATQYSKSPLVQATARNDFPSPKLHISGGSSSGGISQWHLDEFIGLDSGKLGDPYCSDILRAADGELEGIDCMGQVPETFWAVPQIASPPTSSGLYWPTKNCQNQPDSAVFVPDISSSPFQSFDHHDRSLDTSLKRRRRF
ncbi:B-box zinc finger protein 22 [Phtheirospermum japonicum]|uniref:B-box zinc finger protein 22 n=1 Tax=Phtheirospermum japonicum TaxID=374723 RepID=A0A830AWP2_9LAMI|nr:B-box zinc finger protein 22 [Phtheirospermum japonicum]